MSKQSSETVATEAAVAVSQTEAGGTQATDTALVEEMSKAVAASAGDDAYNVDPEVLAEDTLSEVETGWATAMFKAETGDEDEKAIDDERLADWYGKTMLDLEADIDRLKLQLEANIRRVEGRIRGLEFRFGARVNEFVRTRIKGAKTKSVNLDRCTLGFRAIPEKAEFNDPARVQEFAETYEHAGDCATLVTPPPPPPELKIDKAKLLNAIKTFREETGQLPAGIGIVGGNDKFYVKAPPASKKKKGDVFAG